MGVYIIGGVITAAVMAVVSVIPFLGPFVGACIGGRIMGGEFKYDTGTLFDGVYLCGVAVATALLTHGFYFELPVVGLVVFALVLLAGFWGFFLSTWRGRDRQPIIPSVTPWA